MAFAPILNKNLFCLKLIFPDIYDIEQYLTLGNRLALSPIGAVLHFRIFTIVV